MAVLPGKGEGRQAVAAAGLSKVEGEGSTTGNAFQLISCFSKLRLLNR